MTPYLLFCCDPFDLKMPDLDFGEEFTVSKNAGFTNLLFSFEELTKAKDAKSATGRIKPATNLQKIIYRGWMLKPADYLLLYTELFLKNYQLINTPAEYTNCHYLPNSYKYIVNYTPKSVWVQLEDGRVNYPHLFNAIKVFGNASILIKDYVKSQKHYWHSACFIPSAANKEKVQAVVDKFVELQGDDINEGIVVREFVLLADIATHSKSGMPLTEEYRLFFLNRELAGYYDYWEEGEYKHLVQPPIEMFTNIAQTIESNFFSLDIAKTEQGDWIIIETGDGQVAGLPEKADKQLFYQKVKEHFYS